MSAVVPSEAGRGSGRIADLDASLTPRQLELLALVASGYSYADIARIKFFSPHTVQRHMLVAVNRAGARSTTHLVALIVESRLVVRNSDGIYEPVQDLRIAGE